MKLGLLTTALAELDLDEIIAWSADEGFEGLEVACWPRATAAERRYAGVTHIDVLDFDADDLQEKVAGRGLEISALAYYPNNLDPDPVRRGFAHDHLRAVIDAAAALRVPTVGTFVGGDKSHPVSRNLKSYRKEWPPLLEYAGERNVKIAIENCPMLFSDDEWPSGENVAWSPAIWDELFDLAPASVLGLNLDPSHLVWLMIDYERAIYDFGDRIFHTHAKDMEVRGDELQRFGVLTAGIGWQVPRIPGLGQVDWPRFVSALYAVGFDGVLSVEHEDKSFEGSPDRVKRGFRIARDNLSPLVH